MILEVPGDSLGLSPLLDRPYAVPGLCLLTVVCPTPGTVRALGRDLGTEQMGILLVEERHPTSMSEHVAD